MEKLPVSVVINTLNEEKNIKNCLESVKWADDIVICDMYSEDKTVEIAKEYTERIFYFEKMNYVEPARQYAVEQSKYEWVLIVDADELVPYKMYLKIREIIRDDLADIVWFPHNNYFFGQLLEYTQWGPLQDLHPRLFKKSFMDLSPAIHSIFKPKNNPRILKIINPEEGFIHFNYIDVEHFIDKLNRYTTIEAQNMYEGVKKRPKNFFYEIIILVKEFIGRFVKNKGYKDGVVGFYLSILMVAYRSSSFLKYRIMKKYNTKNPKNLILADYQKIVEKVLGEYRN